VFSEVTESNYTCTIPFVYEEMNNNDPLLPVQFYYIPDFVKSYTITGIKDNHELPAVVSQNFPNPFSSKTFIKVHLLQDTHVTLEIYNLTGSLVRTTDIGYLAKGIHDLEYDAGGLSRGIYFYSVNTGAGRVTKKMIVQ